MTQIFLLRHGNTFDAHETPVMLGRTDLPLTAQGILQGQKVALYFKNKHLNFSKIYCGELKRQQQTAKLLQVEYLSTPIQTHAALNEMDYGLWEGLTPTEVQQKWPDEYAAWSHQAKFPGHIFNESFEKRLTLLKQLLTDALTYESVAFVGSQGIFRLLLKFSSQWDALVQNKNFEHYKISTGAFCEATWDGQDLKILNWNVKP